ncbi:MAG: hypothetical protein H6R01_433 [Burkholderiaceae bacterium]|nr:hypothetical protein [Burkholderiaceae bacterium]
MKVLSSDPRYPQTNDIQQLIRRMYDLHREIAAAVNQLSNQVDSLEKRIKALE